MKIAIVGSSHLSDIEEAETRKCCGLILNSLIKEWGTDEEGIPFLFDIPKWKGLLQQAVISDDPIDYYYKNM